MFLKLNTNIKKLFYILLSLIMVLSLMTSCFGKQNNEESNNTDENRIQVNINGDNYKIDSLNDQNLNNDSVAYNRNYKIDDEYSLHINGDHSKRVVIVIDEVKSYGNIDYKIQSVLTDDTQKNNITIPVNGLVLSIEKTSLDSSSIENIAKYNEYSKVIVSNYKKTEYEDHKRCTLAVD